MKLLIVDDHQRIRETIKLLVSDLADDILEATDGTEAVTACTVHEPDWILMDLEMKEMDGIEATRKIRAIHPEARILVLTSFDDDFMRAAALAAGAFGFVLKDNLSEAIRFLEDYPASGPRLAPSLDESISPWPVRGPAASAAGAEGARRAIDSSTAADPSRLEDGNGQADNLPAGQEPIASKAPGVWAASCRDCAVHALQKLAELPGPSNPIHQAIRSIRRSLESSLWLDEMHLRPIKGRRAFTEWHQAVRSLAHGSSEPSARQMRNGEMGSVNLEAIEDLLQGAALLVAQTVQFACDAVADGNVHQQEEVDAELSKAQAEITQADAKLAAKEFDLAVLQYGKAWLHASFAASLGSAPNN